MNNQNTEIKEDENGSASAVESLVMCPLCGKPPFIEKMNGHNFPDTYECSDLSGDCPLSVMIFSKEQWGKFKPCSPKFIECAACGKHVPDDTFTDT